MLVRSCCEIGGFFKTPNYAKQTCHVGVLCYNTRMNMPVKITKVGNSAGIILPKELLARLRAGVGDTLYVTEAPDGIRLTAADPDFAEKMAAAERVMREDRDILRELAK